ncbi:hypothetical protein PGB90_007389 [Kerria lacca]
MRNHRKNVVRIYALVSIHLQKMTCISIKRNVPFQKEIEYHGYIIRNGEIRKSTLKIAAVQNMHRS